MFVNPLIKYRFSTGASWRDLTDLTGMSRSHLQRLAHLNTPEKFSQVRSRTIIKLEHLFGFEIYPGLKEDYSRLKFIK